MEHAELRRVFSGGGRVEPQAQPAPEPEPEPEPEPDLVISEAHLEAASTDSWKAWSGRKEGSDAWQFGDLWSGAAHSFAQYRRQWKGDSRRSGKECPVCLEAEPPPDASGKRWMRLYCGCTVCSGCVRSWNVSVIDDAGSAAKLSCPVCRADMRPFDAEQTLVRCNSVARRHDLKARDDALRSMTDAETGSQEWHPCPHCKTGGGFVSETCLAARHSGVRRDVDKIEVEELRHLAAEAEAETDAARQELGLATIDADWRTRAQHRRGETAAVLCGAPLLTLALAAAGMPRCSAAAAGLAGFFAWGHHLCSPDRERDYEAKGRFEASKTNHESRAEKQRTLAGERRAQIRAKRAELLEVGCPCCDATFSLPESSLEEVEGRPTTQRWVEEHARGCPVCGAAIEKNGGCDHMHCTRCNTKFGCAQTAPSALLRSPLSLTRALAPRDEPVARTRGHRPSQDRSYKRPPRRA